MTIADLLFADARTENAPLFRACRGRRYIGFGPCNSTRAAVAGRYAACTIARLEQGIANQTSTADKPLNFADQNMAIAYGATVRSMEFNHPTYFVAPEFFNAIATTKLPQDLPVADLHWPVPVLTFILPKGALISPTDGECTYLTIARLPAGWKYTPEVEGQPIAGSHMTLINIITTAELNNSPLFARSHPEQGTLAEWVKGDPAYSTLNGEATIESFLGRLINGGKPSDVVTIPPSKDDLTFLDQIAELAAKLLFVMTAAPHLIEPAALVRAAKRKKGVEKPELWSPNILGRHYTMKREHQGGTHASPRAHIRNGHMRQQPYGPRNEKPTYRSIWIEPVLVGAYQ